MSAATWALFFQLEKISKAMQLEMMQYSMFRRHARNFLELAIIYKWNLDRKKVATCNHIQNVYVRENPVFPKFEHPDSF